MIRKTISRKPGGRISTLLGFLGFHVGEAGRRQENPNPEPLLYRQRDEFLCDTERELFRALCQAIGNRALIFPKVRIADIVHAPVDFVNRPAFFEKINSECVDFLICDRKQHQILCVIELED